MTKMVFGSSVSRRLRPMLAATMLAALLSPGGLARAAEGDVWVLKDIVVARAQPDDRLTVDVERHDAAGGEMVFTVSGAVLDTCPGGSETLRFAWSFPVDVTSLGEGQVFDVAMEAAQVGTVAPCGDHIATNSHMTAWGRKGASGANIPEEAMVPYPIDEDRFVTLAPDPRAYVKSDPMSATGQIRLDAYDPVPGETLAYFTVRFVIFGTYEIGAVYLYEKGEGAGTVTGQDQACGFQLGSGIYTKWTEYGGEAGRLGCATGDEVETTPSAAGTIGKIAPFGAGMIVWHGNGERSGQTFAVEGCIATVYAQLGTTGSWLGFPTSDEYDVPGGRRSDFEAGYVAWDAATRECSAKPY